MSFHFKSSIWIGHHCFQVIVHFKTSENTLKLLMITSDHKPCEQQAEN